MAVTSKVLFRGAATTNTGTTLYTVPNTTTTTVITNIAVTNTNTTTPYTFTLSIDGVALHTATTVAPSSTTYIDCKQVIPANNPAKTITGGASNTAINYHISGVEIA